MIPGQFPIAPPGLEANDRIAGWTGTGSVDHDGSAPRSRPRSGPRRTRDPVRAPRERAVARPAGGDRRTPRAAGLSAIVDAPWLGPTRAARRAVPSRAIELGAPAPRPARARAGRPPRPRRCPRWRHDPLPR